MRRTNADWMRKRWMGACVVFLSSATVAQGQSPEKSPSEENGSLYGRPVVVRTTFAAPLRPVTPVVTAHAADLQADSTAPELVPAPMPAHQAHASEHHVSPTPHDHTMSSAAAAHGYVVSHDPLWAGYQSDKRCGCESHAAHHHHCQKNHRGPIRKALNKLSTGFDLIMFGRQGSPCGCDNGQPCDASACEVTCGLEPSCDGACDAMLLPGPAALPPAHTHAHGPTAAAPKMPAVTDTKEHYDAVPQAVTTTPQATAPEINTPNPQTPAAAPKTPAADRVQIRTESSRPLEAITAPQRRSIRGIPLPPADPAPLRPTSPRPSSENPFLDDPLP